MSSRQLTHQRQKVLMTEVPAKFIFSHQQFDSTVQEIAVVGDALPHPAQIHQHNPGVESLLARIGAPDIRSRTLFSIGSELTAIHRLEIMSIRRLGETNQF